MRFIIFLLSGAAMFAGMMIMLASKSAIHEIEAFVLFLIAAVLLSGAAIVRSLEKNFDKTNDIAAMIEKINNAYQTRKKLEQPATQQEVLKMTEGAAYCSQCGKADAYADAYNRMFCPNCQDYVKYP